AHVRLPSQTLWRAPLGARKGGRWHGSSQPAAAAVADRGVRSTPSRRTPVIIAALVFGVGIAVIWSATVVDKGIGDRIANNLLGYNAKDTSLTGAAMGALFQFGSGIAGTFTACNIVAFSSIAPLMGQKRSFGSKMVEMAKPLGWLALGMVAVSGTYGAIGAAVGTGIPQLSDRTLGDPVTG